jgi:hypothetical protein
MLWPLAELVAVEMITPVVSVAVLRVNVAAADGMLITDTCIPPTPLAVSKTIPVTVGLAVADSTSEAAGNSKN